MRCSGIFLVLMSAKAGPSNDYGQKAHEDLIITRGAGFRKEKNKKKRGSYRGGEITVTRCTHQSSLQGLHVPQIESHSFKFAD